ncbi:hypothetical protein N7G274_005344 [Stereocaulon virgatum]|uniref:SP-RING-type domain-containing protein n=1 Tax=Stereocaulon virgatum TaxID=373712 RepID=A0ABR4ABC4_9LECA
MSVKEFELSNATTKAFLGGKERSWMTGKSPEKILQPSPTVSIIPILPDHDQGASPAPHSSTEQYKAIENNDLTSIPFPPDFDRGRFPAQRRRRRSTKNYHTRPLACATSSVPPSAPSSPSLVEESFPQSESPSKLPISADNILPSPSPSVETRRHSAQVLDIEDEVTDAQISRPPFTTRLEELVAKYGGFEQLEKRLEDAEKPSCKASSIVTTQPEGIASNTGLSKDSSYQERSQSLDDRPSGTKSNVEALHTKTPQKRVQCNTNEPRKRTQGDRRCSHAAPDHQSPTPSSGPSDERPRSPPNAQAEMRNYRERIMFRLQNEINHQNHRGSNVERPRLELLRDACGRSDYFYLTLHQIFCLDHRYRGVIGLTNVHRNGLNVLSFLLVPNEQLTSETIEWFSIFPLPVELYEKRPAFQAAQGRVMRCLELLGTNWEVMRSQCTLRRYPPLVDELVGHFNIASLTFQKVISTALLRDIWILPQDQCYHAAEMVFERNHKEVMGRSNALIQDIQAYNQSIIEAYQRILFSHMSHVQTAADTTMGPPQHPQSSSSASRNIRSHQHRTLTGRIVEDSPPTALQVDVQAAREIAHVDSDGPRTRTLSVSGKQTASYVAAASSPTPAGAMSSYDTTATHELSTPQSASFTQSPNQLQGFRSPLISNNQPGQVQALGQYMSQPMLGSPLQSGSLFSHMGIPARRPAHILPSNPPRSTHTSRHHQHHQQQRVLGMQPLRSLHAQSQSPQTQMHSFPVQLAIPNGVLPRSSAPHPDQFIRFDSALLPSQPNPESSAFHQAHASSPLLASIDLEGKPSNNIKHYRFVSHVIMPTRFISSNNRHVGWDFAIKKELFELLAQDQSGLYGSYATRSFTTKSRMCRVRCVKADKPKVDMYKTGELKVPELISQSEWVVADNIWPGSTAVLLNGTALEIRKKFHHGKDLPIDATRFIKEGDNHISTAVIGFDKDNNAHYAIGLEIIQVTDEEQIRKSIPTLGWQDARQRIIDRSLHTDPDVQVVHSQMIIDLTDPFTARLFEIPVRGSTCHHNQCFDRDVFLQTRSSRNPTEPCGPDEFRCPICGADARPPSLVIDGFFVSVREELERKGRLDAKRIVLHELGDWEIKEEEEATGEQGDGTGKRVSVARPGASTEVIEIDDD